MYKTFTVKNNGTHKYAASYLDENGNECSTSYFETVAERLEYINE